MLNVPPLAAVQSGPKTSVSILAHIHTGNPSRRAGSARDGKALTGAATSVLDDPYFGQSGADGEGKCLDGVRPHLDVESRPRTVDSEPGKSRQSRDPAHGEIEWFNTRAYQLGPATSGKAFAASTRIGAFWRTSPKMATINRVLRILSIWLVTGRAFAFKYWGARSSEGTRQDIRRRAGKASIRSGRHSRR